MDFEKYKQSLKDFSNKGEIEWQEFLSFWESKNPAPEFVFNSPKPNVFLGIKFWLTLLAAIGAGLLSAFRVGERFYSVALGASDNSFFAVGETISAIFAVNMTIFALAILVAYRKKKMSTNSQNIGLIVAIVISAVAGLGQAFKGLGLLDVVVFFDLVLAFVMGVGVTALEYLTGDMLGVEIVTHQDNKKVSEQEYRTSYDDAYDKYLKEHKHWVTSAKSNFGSWRSNYERWNSGNTKPELPSVVTHTNEQVDRVENLTNRVFELMDEHYRNGNVLGVTQLGRMLAPDVYGEEEIRDFVARKKGNISQVRRKWMKLNNVS